MRSTSQPRVLTIAGSDSGGGAGLQADLHAFALSGVRAATVVTCLTAQNQNTVSRIEPVSPKMIRAQLDAIFAIDAPTSAKTGMLYSAPIIHEIGRFFRKIPNLPLVVDPVMVATSGRRLLQNRAIDVLKNELLPLATLVTPNRFEAEILLGAKINSPEDMRVAARSLHRQFGSAALVKGGHVEGTNEAIDILFDGKNEWMFAAPRVWNIRLHGTGCAYSAAIVAGIALGKPLALAVSCGKQFITNRIYDSKQRRTAFARVSG